MRNNDHIKLWNALRPLNTIVSFMNIGAHPDDERSDLLAFLSRGLGVQTAAVIANRGEGGQNAIGSEHGNALGVLRTEEMRKAAAAIGIETIHLSRTFDDSIYDHGFEKTAGATLDKWGFDTTYSRLIKEIRTYKPDIVMPCFRDDELEHGHHRAMTALTAKAFKDAADPDIYPEQLQDGLTPWQIRKLYLPADEATVTLSIEIGDKDPATGLTYPQLGEQSRAYHRSQGMGEQLSAEPRTYHLELAGKSGQSEETGLFSGIPRNFEELAATFEAGSHLRKQLEELHRTLANALALFPDRKMIFDQLETAALKIEELIHLTLDSKLSSDTKSSLLQKITIKKRQIAKAAFTAANLTISNEAESVILNPGRPADLSTKITNNGPIDGLFIEHVLQTPQDWKTAGKPSLFTLNSGEHQLVHHTVPVPEHAQYHHPYEAPPITQRLQLYGNKAVFNLHVDDLRNAFVLPELGIFFVQDHIAINTRSHAEPVTLKAVVRNFTKEIQRASLNVQLPANWKITKQNEPITIAPGSEQKVEFTLIPPANCKDEELEFSVSLDAESGKSLSANVQEIGHDHVAPEFYIREATVRATLFSLEKPASIKIGYVDSGFDRVADHLAATGFNVTKLSQSDIAESSLTVYDTIVIGTRAYLSRNELTEQHERLMDYVKRGGHLVVQYHKPTDGFSDWVPGPYPIKLGTPSLRWRVADEKADVKLTNPFSALFTYPNAIQTADWAGWKQERGLYFPMNWASQYETVLQVGDQDESPMDSGILLANYGKGTYLYTNLIFHRQIQEQHAGAYRIFTNMLCYGKAARQQSDHGWIFKKSSKSLKATKSAEAL